LAEIDLNKLSTGDRVIGVSGILLFVFSFFNWFGVEVEGFGSDAKSAWGFTLPLIATLLGIVMVALIVLKLLDTKLPELGGITWGQVMLGLGVFVFAIVLIKVIIGIDVDDSFVNVEETREIGAFLGLIASAGLAAGGFLKFQEEKAGSSAA
jgi:hypothetical protein